MRLRRHVAIHDGPRAADAQLVEEEAELVAQMAGNLVGRRLGQVPQLRLERTNRLLPGLVEELLLGLPVLALIGALLAAPGHHPLVEVGGEAAGVVEEVLEAGRQVDLRRPVGREVVEGLIGKGGGSMLDAAGQAVLVARNRREALHRVEIDVDGGHAPVGQHDTAVAGPGLDAHLAHAGGLPTVEQAEVPVR